MSGDGDVTTYSDRLKSFGARGRLVRICFPLRAPAGIEKSLPFFFVVRALCSSFFPRKELLGNRNGHPPGAFLSGKWNPDSGLQTSIQGTDHTFVLFIHPDCGAWPETPEGRESRHGCRNASWEISVSRENLARLFKEIQNKLRRGTLGVSGNLGAHL